MTESPSTLHSRLGQIDKIVADKEGLESPGDIRQALIRQTQLTDKEAAVEAEQPTAAKKNLPPKVVA